jgi:hypothetical protein
MIFSETLEIVFYEQCILVNNSSLEFEFQQNEKGCVHLGFLGDSLKVEVYSLEEENSISLFPAQLSNFSQTIDFTKIETKEIQFILPMKDALHLETSFSKKNFEILKLVMKISLSPLSKKFQIFQKELSLYPKFILLNRSPHDITFTQFDIRFQQIQEDDIFYGLFDKNSQKNSFSSAIDNRSFSRNSIIKNLHRRDKQFRQIYDLQSSNQSQNLENPQNHKASFYEPQLELKSLFKRILLTKNDKQRKPLWVDNDFEFMIKTKQGSWSYKMNLQNFEVFNVSMPNPQQNGVLLLSVEIKPISGSTFIVIQDAVFHDIKIQNQLSNCTLECFEISSEDSKRLLKEFPKQQIPGQDIVTIQETFTHKIKTLSKG